EPLKAAADEWNGGVAEGGTQTGPRFLPQPATFAEGDEQARAALSDRVRKDELWAFVEIPATALQPDARAEMRYYSNHPAYRTLVSRLTQRVDMAELGLLERDTSGAIKAAAPIDKVRTVVIPVAMMMIVLFSVMSGAPQLLNSVIEEKMSRISEVLIGSVTP